MNLSLIAFVTLATSFAFATPSVGDKANFALTVTDASNAVVVGELSVELTAYDSATDQWTRVDTQTMQGNSTQNVQQVASSDLLSDEQIGLLLANCVDFGGKLETVTSGSGDIATCAMPYESGTAWIGNVALGVVKLDLPDQGGTHVVAVLQSFKRGQ